MSIHTNLIVTGESTHIPIAPRLLGVMILHLVPSCSATSCHQCCRKESFFHSEKQTSTVYCDNNKKKKYEQEVSTHLLSQIASNPSRSPANLGCCNLPGPRFDQCLGHPHPSPPFHHPSLKHKQTESHQISEKEVLFLKQMRILVVMMLLNKNRVQGHEMSKTKVAMQIQKIRSQTRNHM